MEGLEGDTIGGFNSMLRRQRDSGGRITVSTVLFNDRMKVVHDRTDIAQVPEMTREDYEASGSTALLDAVGHTIDHLDAVHEGLGSDRPDSVIVVIMTDGQENSSRLYRVAAVKRMIEAHRRDGWEFIFVGANIDVVEEASRIGIDGNDTIEFNCDSDGVDACFYMMDEAVFRKRGR
ncbi:MAG: hypothetical protein MJZ38_04310 [archaeon]|nr:hypothetical protein [archaeon]